MKVQDYIVAVMQHWLARGVDGWRLDAACAVPAGLWSRVKVRARDEQAFRGIKEERGNRLHASSPLPTLRYGRTEPQVGGCGLDVGRNLD
jgi:glycosidase